jgi:hypothetical protein
MYVPLTEILTQPMSDDAWERLDKKLKLITKLYFNCLEYNTATPADLQGVLIINFVNTEEGLKLDCVFDNGEGL